MRRAPLAVAVAFTLAALVPLAPRLVPATPAEATEAHALVVDAGVSTGVIDDRLGGVGWHPGGPSLSALQDLAPPLVRIDANLQDVSPAPGTLNLAPLLDAVANVHALGAEPLVILSYMPAWLGAPNAHGRDATKVPPADPHAWERLVHDVVAAVATAPSPARSFEAWNEPDSPIFWQDTPAAWSSMVVVTAQAIARVERETGLALRFGGPATLAPDPVYLDAFVRPLRDDPTLPLDFVSWHFYGNTPFFGPDGNEFAPAQPVYPVFGRQNPLASPHEYGSQIEVMRAMTNALMTGSTRPAPDLLLDEWNLSAAGFDRRHDTNEGAAYDAATLVDMHRAGLDGAAFFQATDAPGPSDSYGGHGLVTRAGVRKPAWWTFWLWHEMAGSEVLVKGAGTDNHDDVWTVASRYGDAVRVLIVNFSASDPQTRFVRVHVHGLPGPAASATIRRIDAALSDASVAEPFDPHTVLTLAPQSVTFLDFTP